MSNVKYEFPAGTIAGEFERLATKVDIATKALASEREDADGDVAYQAGIVLDLFNADPPEGVNLFRVMARALASGDRVHLNIRPGIPPAKIRCPHCDEDRKVGRRGRIEVHTIKGTKMRCEGSKRWWRNP